MSRVQIFWDPGGFELDSLGEKQYLTATDGDTPSVSISIRMLSIDTPELHYPNNQPPSRQDDNLRQLAEWIRQGKAPFLQRALADHLVPRLESGRAGTLHEEQGLAAKNQFQALLAQRLTRPNGTTRRVYLHTADEQFDQHGRLLAYMAPYYTKTELKSMTRKDRATFNYLMVESGWAATFIIYPSLPKYPDLVLFHEAAQIAFQNRLGTWADPLTLTGYEYRMAVKLFQVIQKQEAGEEVRDSSWIERFCVNLATKQIYYPQDYIRVEPYNRLFIWPDQVNDAVARMGLVPG